MAEFVALDAIEAISRELAADQVRYMVVGGLALHAYGGDRVTYDVDLVIQLQPDNVLRAFVALERAGYRPLVPVQAGQFADAASREAMIRDKGMVVLNFWSDRFRETRLDVFVAEPFDFEQEYGLALRDELAPGIELRYPRVDTLIAMKKLAGRPKDLQDIEFLERYGRTD
ncbi:MAG: hypothetical protein P4L83_10725 [Nevskia sp.]|nr:hypothetical protein [Nevskia sp.]